MNHLRLGGSDLELSPRNLLSSGAFAAPLPTFHHAAEMRMVLEQQEEKDTVYSVEKGESGLVHIQFSSLPKGARIQYSFLGTQHTGRVHIGSEIVAESDQPIVLLLEDGTTVLLETKEGEHSAKEDREEKKREEEAEEFRKDEEEALKEKEEEAELKEELEEEKQEEEVELEAEALEKEEEEEQREERIEEEKEEESFGDHVASVNHFTYLKIDKPPFAHREHETHLRSHEHAQSHHEDLHDDEDEDEHLGGVHMQPKKGEIHPLEVPKKVEQHGVGPIQNVDALASSIPVHEDADNLYKEELRQGKKWIENLIMAAPPTVIAMSPFIENSKGEEMGMAG